MKNKASYYSVKIISALMFAYSIVFLLGLTYSFYSLRKIQDSFAASGHADQFHRLMITMAFFALGGLIAVVGSAGLFFLKKFGFYLTLLSIIIFWIISSQQGGGIMPNLSALLIATIVFVYLIYQRKLIFGGNKV